MFKHRNKSATPARISCPPGVTRRKLKRSRRGTAVVEFAICAPILFVIGFGFMNAGIMVQMRHNSKLIGHMAATDVFRSASRTPLTAALICNKYEQMAEDLGIVGLDVSITETDDIAVITTTMSVSENSPIPIGFRTTENIVTETHVYAPFE